MKKIVKKILNKMGYTIIPVNAQPVAKPVVKNPLTMEGILARCKERNIQFETIVDVGASNGLWARTCIKEYPQSYYLLIEAQNVHLDGLNQFKNDYLREVAFQAVHLREFLRVYSLGYELKLPNIIIN